jgi:diguanylate cyclase (GGDEF)-like protein
MAISIPDLVRILLSTVAIVLALLSGFCWSRRRRAPEARIVALLIASAAVYCFGYAGEVAQTTLGRAVFWLHVEYFGIPWIPALWLLLARKQNRLESNLGLVFFVPVITFLGQLTNSLHGLYNKSMSLVPEGPFWVVSVHRGPLAWLNILFLFAALPYGSWLYLSKSGKASSGIGKHTLVLVGSGLLPLFGYFLYLCGWSPWKLDLAPAMLALSVILAYLAVFKFEYFDLIPMARLLVFNSMRDPAIVTDMRGKLVEFNRAAAGLFPGLAAAKPGDEIACVFDDPCVLEHRSSDSRELELIVHGEKQYFDVRVFPLQVDTKQLGWTTIFANITARQRMLEELRRHADTDELTEVSNRRSFVAALKRESARSSRHQFPYSIIFVDLDYFKDINDRFGHAAGDCALRAVAERIRSCLRDSDLLGRYGGDEFAILLPQTELPAALEVASRIRNVVLNSQLTHGGHKLDLTISMGVATCDSSHAQDWKRLLEDADQALYAAKAGGRNRVESQEASASSLVASEQSQRTR